MLPCILAAPRFKHYIQVIMREKMGVLVTRTSVEDFINAWIAQYVLLDENATQQVKAAYPLRAAQVSLTAALSGGPPWSSDEPRGMPEGALQTMKLASGACRVLQSLLCGSALLAALSNSAPSFAEAIPTYGYQVVRTYPHDVNAFTQGLFYKDGFLYESTGLLGRSSIRRVRLETGEVLLKVDFPAETFGEGITDWQQRLVAVTWYSQVGVVLDLKSFTEVQRFAYNGQGWGLTHNDRYLILSDGTPDLRFMDPKTLREVRRLRVTADDKPVSQLNELEWVDGEIFSNVWQTDLIARINPETGKVVGWIDLAGILRPSDRTQGTNVLNGIAYDPLSKRLFVTGKLWPKLFEIRLVGPPKASAR